MLRRLTPAQAAAAHLTPVDDETLAGARRIVEDVRHEGEPALRRWSERLGDRAPGDDLVLDRRELERAADALPADELALLERTAGRIRAFATAQRAALTDVDVPVAGGRAGHRVASVDRAGCYAPGGRYPLPSSVLMTAVTARAAGVADVWVASPRPGPILRAAAAVAGADALLTIGGAQAIAALAFGAGPVPAVDVIVGPGNRWVTAAKQLVSGQVGIDMLAGPSELVVLADDTADPDVIAADLLAQAEHDADARPILVTPSSRLADAVDAALARQLATLPTAGVAFEAVRTGFCALAPDLDAAIHTCNTLAPEHLEVMTKDAEHVASRLRHYGGLFIGASSAEVLGDYGIGPNHVLPTATAARFTGGLSVLNFLRVRTWLLVTAGPELAEAATDAAALARLEGLEGHARSADRRR